MSDSIHVLGLTDMRAREMRAALDAMGDRGSLVTVDLDEGYRAYASALATAVRQVAHHEPDAVLVYRGGLIGVVGLLLSSYYGLPLLIRLNGDVRRQHREKVLEQVREREWVSLMMHIPLVLLTELAFRYADGFVPVAEALTDIVHRQTNCPTERIVSVPNPVPIREYAPPESEPENRWNSDRRRLLTVTNLDFRGKYRGVIEIVEALVPVLRRRPSVEYVIAGDGRYHERLERFLADRVNDDVRNRIHTPGYVEDVQTLYWSTDVFVYASHIDGYPNVILEAQAAGLPIVTNPAYGISEQIDDGKTGVFVDVSDAAEFARVVESLLDDPDERERLGRNARRRVTAENADDVVGRKLHDAIRQILTDREETTSAGETAIRPK